MFGYDARNPAAALGARMQRDAQTHAVRKTSWTHP